MNIFKVLFTTTILTASTLQHLFSQQISDVLDPTNSGAWMSVQKQNESIDGNPFLFEDWKSVKLYFLGNSIQIEEFNYHVVNNLLVMKLSGETYLLNSSKIDGFSITDQDGDINYIRIKHPDKHEIVYAEVLNISTEYTSLLIFDKVVSIPDQKHSYSTKSTKANIKERSLFVIKSNSSGEITPLLKKYLKDKPFFVKVSQLVKTHHFNLHKREDVIKLTQLMSN